MAATAVSNVFACQPGDIVIGKRPNQAGSIALVIGTPWKLVGQFRAWVGGFEGDGGELKARRLFTFWFGGQPTEGQEERAELGLAISDCRIIDAGELVEREGLAWLDAAEGHCSPRVTTEVNDGSSNGGLFTEPSFARGRTSEGASPAAARAP